MRRLREETAQEIVDHVRGAIDTESSVALISLGRSDLPTAVARQLDAMRMTVAVAEDLMGHAPGAPFALNLERIRLASSLPTVETRLVVDRTGRRVIFDGAVPSRSIAASIACATFSARNSACPGFRRTASSKRNPRSAVA